MKHLLLVGLVLILTGCAGEVKNDRGPGDKYVKQISSSLKNNYNIPSGELVAKYNILDTSNHGMCLFAKDYGITVSDGIASLKFLHSAKRYLQNPGMLQNNSRTKIAALYSYIFTLNTKHNIISDRELRRLQTLVSIPKQSETSSPFDLIDNNVQTLSPNHFANLTLIDQVIKHIPIFLPQTGPIMTSAFGNRKHPIHKKTKFHQGTDFVSSKHSMIHAAANGKVLQVGKSASYGHFILIEHSSILKTRYAHLSKVYSTIGARIFQGELIGLQGNSGNSTAEHLHFEVIYKEKLVDPMVFLGQEYNCRNRDNKAKPKPRIK